MTLIKISIDKGTFFLILLICNLELINNHQKDKFAFYNRLSTVTMEILIKNIKCTLTTTI